MHIHFSNENDPIRADDVYVVGHFLLVYTEPDQEVRLYPSHEIEMVSGLRPEDIRGILRNGAHTE